ncbi:MAG: hypothetical protein P1V81_11495 [Planctomycetota bacterium]|nr:hypothetical protein [Planctomycetota bacterium]
MSAQLGDPNNQSEPDGVNMVIARFPWLSSVAVLALLPVFVAAAGTAEPAVDCSGCEDLFGAPSYEDTVWITSSNYIKITVVNQGGECEGLYDLEGGLIACEESGCSLSIVREWDLPSDLNGSTAAFCQVVGGVRKCKTPAPTVSGFGEDDDYPLIRCGSGSTNFSFGLPGTQYLASTTAVECTACE